MGRQSAERGAVVQHVPCPERRQDPVAADGEGCAGGLLLAVPPAQADGEPARVTVRTLVQSSQAWNGPPPLPAYPSGQPEVTVLHITIPPGEKLPLHQHPVINAGLKTRGQLLVTSSSGATVQLKAGEGPADHRARACRWPFPLMFSGRDGGTVFC